MKITEMKACVSSAMMVLCMIGLTACSQQAAPQDQSAAVSSEQAAAQTASGGTGGSTGQTVFGKVTAVDGSQITLAIGTLKNNGNFRNSGSRAGNHPQGGASGGGNDKKAAPPNRQAGGSASGRGDMLTLTGEKTTITVSDPSIIKKESRGPGLQGKPNESGSPSGTSSRAEQQSGRQNLTSASLSDIKVGTLLRIEKSSDGKLSSIVIMGEAASQPNSSGQ